MTIHNTLRTIDSQNVMAKIDGADPAHQGRVRRLHRALGSSRQELRRAIFHGAVDNASGPRRLLEIARAFTKVSPPPKRSILFVSVTAEEQGLLGSQYYSVTPVYPLAKTAARTSTSTASTSTAGRKTSRSSGYGASDLDDYCDGRRGGAGASGPRDAEPEKGFYYRSDHFNFAKQGVPALDPDEGVDFVGKPADYGQKVRDDYTNNRYHTPKDVDHAGVGFERRGRGL